MRDTARTTRLAGMGGEKWDLHRRARSLVESGRDVVELTIGEPDIAMPRELVDATVAGLRRGRTGYSDGQGEWGLRTALAERYSRQSGRVISPEQVLCLPGTQTALFVAMMGVAESGDEVVVGDPMYATYEGVVRASGAEVVSVPLRPDRRFALDPADVERCLTDRTTALLLNTPHNPTGAVLSERDVVGLCELAVDHDLWVICDEVYADFVSPSSRFVSPLDVAGAADRVVVVSSISKSHAAPGLRSGWCVAPADFVSRLLPYAEAMLFGNQPFIADATEAAVRGGSVVVDGMVERFADRARRLSDRVGAGTELEVLVPEAGMFAMMRVSPLGMSGAQYAVDLLERAGVAVMPGSSFGSTVDGWVRVALTVDDARFDVAIDRIVAHAHAHAHAAG